MADSETDTREATAELRITRVQALNNHDLVAVVTYLLARHPDTRDHRTRGVSGPGGTAAARSW
jgi:hypothetical protein